MADLRRRQVSRHDGRIDRRRARARTATAAMRGSVAPCDCELGDTDWDRLGSHHRLTDNRVPGGLGSARPANDRISGRVGVMAQTGPETTMFPWQVGQ